MDRQSQGCSCGESNHSFTAILAVPVVTVPCRAVPFPRLAISPLRFTSSSPTAFGSGLLRRLLGQGIEDIVMLGKIDVIGIVDNLEARLKVAWTSSGLPGQTIFKQILHDEVGAAQKTNASERGQSRRHCLIFSLLIGCTDVVLCCDVHLLTAQAPKARSYRWIGI